VSGINRGYNVGFSTALSGTVGAARMAAMFGIPAIAASTTASATASDYIHAAEEVFGAARRVKQYGLPPFTLLNVNVPPPPPGGYKGYMVTSMAMVPGGDERFAETPHPSGRTVYWNVFREGASAPEGTDIWAVANGYTSVTPLRVDETDPAQSDALRAIFK
jgi:5'-nucleotidase